MRPHGKKGFNDFTVRNGEVIVIPWETNLSWTYEVPTFKKNTQWKTNIHHHEGFLNKRRIIKLLVYKET
jgi:hypothetical protein